MARQDPSAQPEEFLSWTLSWDRDRRDDRRSLQVAFGIALFGHAALLAVRMAETVPLIPPQPDAILFPTHNVAIKKPVVPLPPEVAPRPSRPAARRVPVPVEFAPPEPLVMPELPEPKAVLPRPMASIPAIPEPFEAELELPVRFSRDMERPVRISGREPAYTEAARRTRTEGVVVLDAVIDEEGRVTGLTVLRELGFGLSEAAVRAVSGWRFEPATLEGRPIAVRYNLTVQFSLR